MTYRTFSSLKANFCTIALTEREGEVSSLGRCRSWIVHREHAAQPLPIVAWARSVTPRVPQVQLASHEKFCTSASVFPRLPAIQTLTDKPIRSGSGVAAR